MLALGVVAALASCGHKPSGASDDAATACGNGVVESGEACDDGNPAADDGCNTLCQIESGWSCEEVEPGGPSTCAPVCGDGLVVGAEGCDDGNGDNTDACPDAFGGTCQSASCGDGFVRDGQEQCDDGNIINGDGCSDICNIEECGNGVVEDGEGCDDGNSAVDDSCPDGPLGTCQPASCGDEYLWTLDGGTETCDDGNTTPGDGCDATCQDEYVCGNGTTDPGEECDDSNTTDGDGCSASCVTEYCGDGITQGGLGEFCDDGNNTDGDGCDATCQLEICTDTLSTPFNANLTGADGNMFDVAVLQAVTIDSFDVNCTGTNDWEIYYRTGTWEGNEGSPTGWTLIASPTAVVCNAADTPTPLGLDLNLMLTAGQTVAFYITVVNDLHIRYTFGAAVGDIVAQDSCLQILEGASVRYPYSNMGFPRVWNGTIIYCQ